MAHDDDELWEAPELLPPDPASQLSDKELTYAMTHVAHPSGHKVQTALGTDPARSALKPQVQRYIDQLRDELKGRMELDTDHIVAGLIKIFERCMQAEPVMQGKVQTGVWKFDSTGATKALELLGKYIGMFPERVRLSGDPDNPTPINSVTVSIGAEGIRKAVSLIRRKRGEPDEVELLPPKATEGRTAEEVRTAKEGGGGFREDAGFGGLEATDPNKASSVLRPEDESYTIDADPSVLRPEGEPYVAMQAQEARPDSDPEKGPAESESPLWGALPVQTYTDTLYSPQTGVQSTTRYIGQKTLQLIEAIESEKEKSKAIKAEESEIREAEKRVKEMVLKAETAEKLRLEKIKARTLKIEARERLKLEKLKAKTLKAEAATKLRETKLALAEARKAMQEKKKADAAAAKAAALLAKTAPPPEPEKKPDKKSGPAIKNRGGGPLFKTGVPFSKNFNFGNGKRKGG